MIPKPKPKKKAPLKRGKPMARKTLTASEVLDAAMTEKELKRSGEQMLKLFGYWYYHTFFSQYSAGGFPDEFATKDNRTLFIEWKTMKGKLSEKQIEALDVISDNPPLECYVIRPNQLQVLMDILASPDPYQGPERWTRENHYGECHNFADKRNDVT